MYDLQNNVQWTLNAILNPPPADGLTNLYFGAAVSVYNSWALIGAPEYCSGGNVTSMGISYMYSYNGTGWVYNQSLMATAQANQYFGYSTFISTNSSVGFSAIVGAFGYTATSGTTSASCGAVYMYSFNSFSWTQSQLIVSPGFPSSTATAYFGYSVALRGRYALVGAPLYSKFCVL